MANPYARYLVDYMSGKLKVNEPTMDYVSVLCGITNPESEANQSPSRPAADGLSGLLRFQPEVALMNQAIPRVPTMEAIAINAMLVNIWKSESSSRSSLLAHHHESA